MVDETYYVILQMPTKHGNTVVGVLPEAPKESYKYDNVGLWLEKKNKSKNLLVMTPREAVMIGVSLIRASILAEIRILKNNPKDADWATNWEKSFQEPDYHSGNP
jgi:hypothetical protein